MWNPNAIYKCDYSYYPGIDMKSFEEKYANTRDEYIRNNADFSIDDE
jgi:hypothetical protein